MLLYSVRTILYGRPDGRVNLLRRRFVTCFVTGFDGIGSETLRSDQFDACPVDVMSDQPA